MANLQGVIRAPDAAPNRLIWNGRGGELTADVEYWTGITGHRLDFARVVATKYGPAWVDCSLFDDGRLAVRTGTQWDFGSGPAVDTPAVVIASLAHDMICHLTNYRLIPWQCRAMGDRMYRVMLEQNGAGLVRRGVHWIGVRGYSELIARWRDKKCD